MNIGKTVVVVEAEPLDSTIEEEILPEWEGLEEKPEETKTPVLV